MRTAKMFFAAVLPTLAAVFSASSAAGANAVALGYHFAGAAALAGDTNFDTAKKIFGIPPSAHFRDLVLDRLAGVFWSALQFDRGGDCSALRPLLDDLLQAESIGSFGGRNKERMNLVLAARLDDKRAQAWQMTLETALHGKGAPLAVEGFSGWQWNRPGGDSLWMLRARNWTVAGRGEDLLPVRADYLQQIRQSGQPHPVVKDSWLGADIDWPLLAQYAPLSSCPFKLARTIVNVTASGGKFHATAHVSYPEAMPWKSQPWRIPRDLVGSPLVSFSASQDVEAFLNPDATLSRLSANPLDGQFFCWALRELALETCAAWPVADATNAVLKLGAEAPAAANPRLEARNHSQLTWMQKDSQLAWTHLQLTAPIVTPARGKNGDFLLAKVFPLTSNHTPPSDELWRQFQGHDDMVYYGWELTGPRVMQWRLLTEILPILPQPTREQMLREQKAAEAAKSPDTADKVRSPLRVTDQWLSALTPFLGNSVTEVTRTSPSELTAARSSPFLFDGLELVLLSHWLADAPIGPIDYNLLPKAKMSGPGLGRLPH